MSKLQAMPKSYTKGPRTLNLTLQDAVAGLTVLILMGSCVARAETYHLSPPANQVSKFEALSQAAKDPDTIIYKCSATKITSKFTLKNIPASGTNEFMRPPTESDKKAVQEAKK